MTALPTQEGADYQGTVRLRLDVKDTERDATDGVRRLAHLGHLLTAALIEHGPLDVSHERIGEASLGYEVVVFDTADGIRIEAVKRA